MLEFLKNLGHQNNEGDIKEALKLLLNGKKSALITLILKNLERLITKTVKDIMVPRVRVEALSINASAKEIIETIQDYHHTRYPVIGENMEDIKGILHVKDIFRYFLKLESIKLEQLLRKPLYVSESTRIDNVLIEFQRFQSHMAIVVDDYHGFAGIVCLEDVIEEIVGEIKDEHDTDEMPFVHQINEYQYEIDGLTEIQEFTDKLGFDLPEEGWGSVGGFILHLAGESPKIDDSFDFKGINFKVMEMTGSSITKLLVTLPSA